MNQNWHQKSYSIIIGILLIVPFLLVTNWHFNNDIYPGPDSAHIFSLSQEIYQVGKNQGLIEALNFAYMHRHWRPIAPAVIVTPILFFTDGNIFKGLEIVCYILAFLFLCVVFYFLRNLEPSATIILGSFTILFSGPFLTIYTMLGGESFFVLSGVFCFLLFFNSQGQLADRKKLILFFALAAFGVMSRPLEALALLTPMMLFSVWKWHQLKRVGTIDLYILGLATLLLIILFYFPSFRYQRDWTRNESLYIFAILTGLCILLSFFRNRRTPILDGIVFFFLPITFWYLPATHSIFYWIAPTTFGELAIADGKAIGAPMWLFWSALAEEVGLGFFIIIVLGLISLLFYKKLYFSKNIKFIAFSALCLILNPILGSLTLNWDQRYYFPNFFAFAMLSLQLLDGITGLPRRLIQICLAVLMTINLYSQIAMVNSLQNPGGGSTLIIFSGKPKYYNKPRSNSSLELFSSQLLTMIEENITSIMMFWNDDQSNSVINAWTTQMFLHDKGKPHFIYHYELSNSTMPTSKKLDLLKMGSQYIIIGPIERPERSYLGHADIFNFFATNCQFGTCIDPDFLLVGRIKVPASENHDNIQYLLIRSLKYPQSTTNYFYQ